MGAVQGMRSSTYQRYVLEWTGSIVWMKTICSLMLLFTSFHLGFELGLWDFYQTQNEFLCGKIMKHDLQ